MLIIILTLQGQSPGSVFENKCPEKFRKSYSKHLEYLFLLKLYAAGLQLYLNKTPELVLLFNV